MACDKRMEHIAALLDALKSRYVIGRNTNNKHSHQALQVFYTGVLNGVITTAGNTTKPANSGVGKWVCQLVVKGNSAWCVIRSKYDLQLSICSNNLQHSISYCL